MLTDDADAMAQGTVWKARVWLGLDDLSLWMVPLRVVGKPTTWAAWLVRNTVEDPCGFPGLFAGYGEHPEAAMAMLHGRMNVNIRRAERGESQVPMMAGAAHGHNMLVDGEWVDVT